MTMGKKALVPLFVLLAAGIFFYSVLAPADAPAGPVAAGPRLNIEGTVIPVELARTDDEVQKGLSGRPSLDPDKGMLFLFTVPGIYRFWMPDMNFPLDIVWIGSNKKVIGISADVSNEFDPADPKFYTPPAPAQYVLEVNAGFASRKNLAVGASVEFTDIGP